MPGLGPGMTRQNASQENLDALDLGVVVDSLPAELTAHPGGLVAAKRSHEIHGVLVHAISTGPYPAGDVQTLVDVANAHGMHAWPLEIFTGLVYLDYTDDPMKELRKADGTEAATLSEIGL